MISWGVTVGIIMLLNWEFLDTEFRKITALGILFAILYLGVWIATQKWSSYIRVFLRKISGLHILIMLLCFMLLEIIWYYFPNNTFPLVLLWSFSGIIFASAIEESSKHLSTVGLTAREFRFSRQDFIIFTLFVTLGFIFVENLIYLIDIFQKWPGQILYLGFMRIFFAFLAHFFAASICVVIWWKALSYGFFSWRYILFFFMGYVLSVASHATFNLLLDKWYFTGIIIFAIVSYIFCTQWLLDETQE